MTWRNLDYPFPYDFIDSSTSTLGSLALNEQCFIRKQHKCGKMFGASKSCFIACPTDDDLEPILELMSEKLTKVGIEPIIAVKERAYGQDIFCTKICGKIIEARFCVVILDDTIRDGKNTPNPNVYYEYGLMTSMRKHIIPLQKDGLDLAFNIQSYDTIKYNAKNIAAEIDRAIRDGIRLTEAKEPPAPPEIIPDKMIMRRMELAGFEAKDEKWFLSEVISDTSFRGFGQHKKSFYVYVGRIDSLEDAQTYLDDLSVVIYRTEKKAGELKDQLDRTIKDKASRVEERRRSENQAIGATAAIMQSLNRQRIPLAALDDRIGDIEDKLKLMAMTYVAFVATNDLDLSDFARSTEALIAGHERYRVVLSQEGHLQLGDVTVDLSMSHH